MKWVVSSLHGSIKINIVAVLQKMICDIAKDSVNFS